LYVCEIILSVKWAKYLKGETLKYLIISDQYYYNICTSYWLCFYIFYTIFAIYFYRCWLLVRWSSPHSVLKTIVRRFMLRHTFAWLGTLLEPFTLEMFTSVLVWMFLVFTKIINLLSIRMMMIIISKFINFL